jgi:hypothetical protein
VEVIRRPFLPSLADEIAVVQGNEVKMLMVYDDRWSYVEKVSAEGVSEIFCPRHMHV